MPVLFFKDNNGKINLFSLIETHFFFNNFANIAKINHNFTKYIPNNNIKFQYDFFSCAMIFIAVLSSLKHSEILNMITALKEDSQNTQLPESVLKHSQSSYYENGELIKNIFTSKKYGKIAVDEYIDKERDKKATIILSKIQQKTKKTYLFLLKKMNKYQIQSGLEGKNWSEISDTEKQSILQKTYDNYKKMKEGEKDVGFDLSEIGDCEPGIEDVGKTRNFGMGQYEKNPFTRFSEVGLRGQEKNLDI
jgi:hypothetical protein